jgi:hypothetical protein
MRLLSLVSLLLTASLSSAAAVSRGKKEKGLHFPIAPKVVIISYVQSPVLIILPHNGVICGEQS